ncbi:TLD domain-containing protein 2-like isoform X2 [Phoenix dactylifera]|uniref:Oxidation resistance protein 1 n=1 Tax=Phoenix dactylifera TaxID=42345 RepID=A0A8B8ZSL1_PHODC|nr:TLD domain-containing protein 2-like isoform X2 [Phoenix dactylifera]
MPSLRSKAVHLVSDLTTVILNPISDEPSKPPVDGQGVKNTEKEASEEDSGDPDGPDTSSFTAFLISLLSSSDTGSHPVEDLNERHAEMGDAASASEIRENSGKKSLLSREDLRNALYAALPSLVQGRNWLLLYSTWRHGISLSTLYRRSMLCPGYSLLVVGDQKGAVFGGLVEAPLCPTNRKKYQGTNRSFVFTNLSSHPVIYRPTGSPHQSTSIWSLLLSFLSTK